ncbi:ionotropic receptor 25a-like [Dermacentor albipictus]|uniref:ionotropic receptor 25a-like n=1 Tax=Dermacentor albipictus TaxID=60249 RepID=UPI0031FDFDDA
MTLAAGEKGAFIAAFLAAALVAATAQNTLRFVVAVEKGNDVAKLMITETLRTTTSVSLTYSLVELDPEEVNVADVCNAIFADPKPHVLIDAVRTPGSTVDKLSTAVRDTARRMGLPTLSLTYGVHNDYTLSGWDRLTALEREFLVHVTPPGDIYTQVIRDLCKKMDLSTAGIIYDSSVIIDHKYARLLENIPTRHIMREVDGTKDDFKRKAELIHSTDVSNFFILGRADTMNQALELAHRNKWNNWQFAWFLISREKYTPKCSECGNVTFIMATPQPTSADLLAEAMKDKDFNAQTEQVDAAFYSDVTSMVIRAAAEEIASRRLPPDLEYPTCTDMNLTSSMLMERRNITLRTTMMEMEHAGPFGPIVIRENENGYQAISMSVQRVNTRKAKKMNITTIARWTYKDPEGTLVESPGEDLGKYAAVTVFRVTTIVQPPFIVKKNTSSGEDQFEGYCIDLIDEIKKILKFEYTIYEVQDKMFGSINTTTKQWNGMIRELVDKNADIALGPISVMAERETVVDFTVPYYDLVGISILMKKPEVKSSLFKFLTVLEGNVWGCILAAYFFTSFLMYLFDRLSPYSYRNNKEKYKDDEEKRDFNLKECLWFCMTSLTPQGGGEAPRNLSGRLVAATWWLFGFIIIASYTANLAAFLTVSRLDSPIESLDDLAKQYKIKYAPQKDTSSMTYFDRMAYIESKFYDIWKNMSLDDTLSDEERAKLAVWDYPVSDKYTKIWWTMQEASMPTEFEEGVRRVKESKGSQEGFAFIADSTRVKYATMTNCDLVSVGSEFSRKPLALAVQQNSPLKDQLSSAILKLLNQRRLEGLKETWWNKNPARVTCDDSERQSDGISIRNIGGVFIVIFIGVVMACITLAIEYCYYKNRKPNSKVVAVKEYSGKDSIKDSIKH